MSHRGKAAQSRSMKTPYKKILSDAQKWEEVVHRYKAAADAEVAVHEERIRKGDVIQLDEKGEIFRVYQIKRFTEQLRDDAAQVLRDTGLQVYDNSVLWDEEDPRFEDPRFAPYLYGIIRQHQQAHEELLLLNITVQRAEELGISRRNALLAMPGLIRDFQLRLAPLWEYNLLRRLHLDDVAMAKLTGHTSASTSLRKSPRVTAALEKKRHEEGDTNDLRVKLRQEILGKIGDLPHVDGQLDTSPEGIQQFFEFKNKVLKDLADPPGKSSKEVLANDLSGGQGVSEQDNPLERVIGGEDPLESLLVVENAQEYQDRFGRFSEALSPREKEVLAATKDLLEQRGDGNYCDADIAERLGVPTPNVPNLRGRMLVKYKRSAEKNI